MKLHYGLEDRPPWPQRLLYAGQWFVICLPTLVILAQLAARLQPGGTAAAGLYLQKISLMTAVALLAQVLVGHCLPLVLGPAAVLLVGVLACRASDPAAVTSALFLGGLLLFLLARSSLLLRLQRLFTARVIAVVLLLIAFTLLPLIGQLLLPAGLAAPDGPLRLGFASLLLLVLLLLHRWLTGLGRATLVIWGLMVGTLVWLVLVPPCQNPVPLPWLGWPLTSLSLTWQFDPAVLLAFLVCYLALAVNDLGSMQSLAPFFDLPDLPRRLRRGLAVTGLANMLAAFIGVIGPVNYSFSPGVLAASGCGARRVLLPVAAALGLCALSPRLLGYLSAVPDVVIGVILLYVLSVQSLTALRLLAGAGTRRSLVLGVGLPVLCGTLVAFIPAQQLLRLPLALQPLAGNGFVVGLLAALLLDRSGGRGQR
ncbi:MAG: solute carrier family 23 protein [Desulfuromonas thiophila]|nr:solute carrier family 23 protein [Desulfuromonas thiophila]